jgi:hypothetical protein
VTRFLRRPQLTYAGGPRPWLLETPCVYVTDVEGMDDVFPGGLIEIPAGYRTDLASVPRIPLVYARTGNRAVLPAIVHDDLYENGKPGLTRKQADLVFLEAMQDENDPPWATTRWAMYRAVRMFGWSGWGRYRKAEAAA